MRSSRDFYPVIFVLAAMLIIAMVLAMVYLLGRLSPRQPDDDTQQEKTQVGIKGHPDDMGWRPLFNGYTLDGWEVTNFGPQGPVLVRDSAIILSFGDGATGITWIKDFPRINYEISLEAMRVTGNDFFCGLTFPVGREYCTFIVGGWGGSTVGLSSIDGQDASENFTGTRIRLENSRWYEIRLLVDERAINGFIDNQEVFSVPLEMHRFSIRPEVGLSIPLGIASWVTTAALRNIKFRILPELDEEIKEDPVRLYLTRTGNQYQTVERK
jgi:hypothetical protein